MKEIVFAKDASLQDKSNKLGAYVVVSGLHVSIKLSKKPSDIFQDNVKPVVDQIYEYVIGAKVSLQISSSGHHLIHLRTRPRRKPLTLSTRLATLISVLRPRTRPTRPPTKPARLPTRPERKLATPSTRPKASKPVLFGMTLDSFSPRCA